MWAFSFCSSSIRYALLGNSRAEWPLFQVSRYQAKLKYPLTGEGYTARHKYNFDVIGNELTPSAKYDFKFKDYALWVVRKLHEEDFHVEPVDYLSLTVK